MTRSASEPVNLGRGSVSNPVFFTLVAVSALALSISVDDR